MASGGGEAATTPAAAGISQADLLSALAAAGRANRSAPGEKVTAEAAGAELKTEGDKNGLVALCPKCGSRIMSPKAGTFHERTIAMPKVGASDGEEKEEVQQFWLLTNMMHFDNVGFSKVVDSTIKYLTCADCEIGPLGWHSTDSPREFLLSVERVQYRIQPSSG